jgi:urocanate hydratase
LPEHPADRSAARRAPSPTRTVERALGLLAEVCSAQALSLADCARRADLSPSTALRLLRTLESAEFVARDARGYFHAGPRLIQLGAAALGRESLVRMAEPALQRIVAATGESAYVSVLGPGDTALYVGMVEGTHAVRHASRVGSTVPLAGTAVGRALSGDVPGAGYVVCVSGAEDGVIAIAAPVLRPAGVAGVLSLAGPVSRIHEAEAEDYGELVAREAGALAARYGVTKDADTGRGAGNAENAENTDTPGTPVDMKVARG